jgi:thiamine biosynthesis lipoprotein
MMRRRTFLAGTAGIVSGFALGHIAPIAVRKTRLATLSGPTMGTYFRIVFPDADGIAETLSLNSFGTLAEVDRLMSTYRSDSEVSRFNATGVQSPVQISAHTESVIEEALRICELTDGCFDVTIGPLVELWGFGASGRTKAVPDAGLASQTATRVGMDALQAERGTVWKTQSDLAIDLSGIAKGYAVDQLAEMLDALGVPAYLVDVGGELRAKGRRPDGLPWKVGIERPSQGQRAIHRVIALENRSIATSGDYRNFFVQGGQKYAHVIDPRTARPVTHSLASVTVLDRDAMTADAVSTALMVMGPDEGLSFADQNDVAAYFVARDGDRLVDRYTSAFAPSIDGLV